MDFDLTQNLIHIKNLSGVDFYFHSGAIENCTNLIFLQKQTTFVSIYAAIFHLRRPFLFAVGYVESTTGVHGYDFSVANSDIWR